MTLNTRRIQKKLKKKCRSEDDRRKSKKKLSRSGKWYRGREIRKQKCKEMKEEEKAEEKNEKKYEEEDNTCDETTLKSKRADFTLFEKGILVGLFGKESMNIFGGCDLQTCIVSNNDGEITIRHPFEIKYDI